MASAAPDISQEVSQIRWFHRIDLGNGIITPGVDNTPEKLTSIGMPTDLSGKSVLDIGAWDGFFSFEAERRKAQRVLATDSFIWRGEGWGSKKGFDLARRVLGSKVEDEILNVYEMSNQRPGRFDVVLFLGVLYHLKHPLLALERVFDVTQELLILETHVDLASINRPVMAFYPGSELGADGSNWCGPNLPALTAMLTTAGFSRTQVHWTTPLDKRADPNKVTSARAVVHAWR